MAKVKQAEKVLKVLLAGEGQPVRKDDILE